MAMPTADLLNVMKEWGGKFDTLSTGTAEELLQIWRVCPQVTAPAS